MIPASVVQAVVPKKKNPWWKVSLAFFVIFWIMIAIDINNDDYYEGDTYYEYDSSGYGGYWYECENGESVREEFVNDGDDDCGDGSDESGEQSDAISIIGSGSCCLSLVFGMGWLVTSMQSKENVLIVQQQPQYVPVVQQVQPVIVQQRPPVIRQPPVGPAKVSRNQLLQQAQNMERARDFENAAELYQKAGSYEDAGRVRQSHLEKEQAMVKIGQVGNTVLNDSVMMNNGSPAETTCWACQQPIQQGWNVCPHCQASL